MVRKELAKLPHGIFAARDPLDGDGLGGGPFEVCVKVTIEAERFVIDYTGSHPQVPGPINTTRTGTESRARAIFCAITAPHLQTNGGMFRPLEVRCPEGTVFTAKRPAPTSTYWESGGFAIDLVRKALAPHLPDRLPAGSFLSVCATILSARHPETDELARTDSSALETARPTTSPSKSPKGATPCACCATHSITRTAARGGFAAAKA